MLQAWEQRPSIGLSSALGKGQLGLGPRRVNQIVLGDFNIEQRREDDPLFGGFISEGLMVPLALRDVQSNCAPDAKHYDQIGWFMGDLTLLARGAAGVFDYRGMVYKELTSRQVTDRESDHLPLWVEFVTDRSSASIARSLGLDLGVIVHTALRGHIRGAPRPDTSTPHREYVSAVALVPGCRRPTKPRDLIGAVRGWCQRLQNNCPARCLASHLPVGRMQ